MWQWELTNQAGNDLALLKRAGELGFGVVLGDFLGHRLLVERFLSLYAQPAKAIKAYEDWPIVSGVHPLGIFSIGHPLIPLESFHGILFAHQDDNDEVYFYSYVNGSTQVQVNRLERLDTHEQ